MMLVCAESSGSPPDSSGWPPPSGCWVPSTAWRPSRTRILTARVSPRSTRPDASG